MSVEEREERSSIPEFSIVMEAFTVTAETADSLDDCLASLAAQDLSPEMANEVLLLSVGQIERSELDRICKPYPWAKIVELPAGTRYFGIKMEGARRATGEVVVLCDADNTYLPGSLRSMVAPFGEDAGLNILTGQTSVRCDDLASTAFGLTFFFPPFKKVAGLEEAETYFGNNSAFRREFLMEHPIDTGLPLLRGNDYVHSFWLRQRGHEIWRQTASRAYHAAPESAQEFVLRYLARGSDRLEIWRRTIGELERNGKRAGGAGAPGAAWKVLKENIADFGSRLVGVARQSRRAILYYPLVVPIGMILLGMVFVGMLISYVRPGLLVDRYIQAFHDPGLDESSLPARAVAE